MFLTNFCTYFEEKFSYNVLVSTGDFINAEKQNMFNSNIRACGNLQ